MAAANGYVDAVVGTELFIDAQPRLHPSIRTVMVADDSATLRTILATMLRQLGVKVILEAENASVAFRLLHENAVDLFICDVEMGGSSGLKLLQAIRKTARIDTLPVIMVSGSTKRQYVQEAVTWQADGFMLKPFDAPQLRARINEAVAKRNVKD